MKKLKYYFDTSIFNFRIDLANVDAAKREATKRLFEIYHDLGEVYISEIVLREIRRAPELKQNQLVNLINEYSPELLEFDSESEYLAEKYIEEGIIPEKYRDDARHIAIASVNNLDVIVSWNFEHIVKVKTRLEANGINRLLGYKEIEISSPEEVG